VLSHEVLPAEHFGIPSRFAPLQDDAVDAFAEQGDIEIDQEP